MFDMLLHNHTLPVIGDDGQLTTRRATCAQMTGQHAPHTRTVSVYGPNGIVESTELVNCHTAEAERQALLAERKVYKTENRQLQLDVANYRRLVAGAMQIVFHMGPALQKLLSENLADPTLTDDKSAVKVEAVQFTVLIDPFNERITVRDVAGNVPERSFRVVDGRLSEDDQTLLLGHVNRINTAAANDGADPVQSVISVVETV
jgi:hypothetical protein